MTIYSASSYEAIKEICVQKLALDQQNSRCTYFRGTKTDYIGPSILFDGKHSADDLVKIEENIQNEFSDKYRDTITEGNPNIKDWKLRIKGREHGLMNRLTDWAIAFYNALDFATYTPCSKTLDQEFVYLWILSMDCDAVKTVDKLGKPFEAINESTLVHGLDANDLKELHARRQFVQGGFFLVQPDKHIATKLNEQPQLANNLVCIKIPVSEISNIRIALAKDKDIDLCQSLMIEDHETDKDCETINNKHLQ